MDGTGWGGGCGSEAGDCPTGGGAGPLVFEGPDTTFSPTSPGAAPFTLSVCNSGTSPESLPAGSQIGTTSPSVAPSWPPAAPRTRPCWNVPPPSSVGTRWGRRPHRERPALPRSLGVGGGRLPGDASRIAPQPSFGARRARSMTVS
jgi:hypothetical protein